jgi:Family of unknown function (DUF6101)
MNLAQAANLNATRRMEASDARADGRRRVVIVEEDRIAIARSVAGVFMRINLAPSAFRGILLRLASLDDSGFHYEVHLAHRDPDLSVRLAESDDQAEAEDAWRQWARFFNLSALVERVEGIFEPGRATIGPVETRAPVVRRRGRGLRLRRARFLTRRKVGRPELCVAVARECELSSGARSGL